MAGILTNPQLVEAPSPGRPRYGLFTAARVTDDLDARTAAAGFQFPAEDCGVARLYDANCDTHPGKIFDEGLGYVAGDPYWVYATHKCGSVGRTPQDVERTVRRKLAGAEQEQVEAAVWGGTSPPVDPALTTTAGVVAVTPDAPGAGAAIAALEHSFYDTYGYIGTIHINTRAYAALTYAELISDSPSAGVLTTPLGSQWSIGSGYGITGPAGAAPDAGSVWAFMTPPVWIRRMQQPIVPNVVQTMDRTYNQFMALAERVYAHTWACPIVHAVQVPIAAPAVVDITPPEA
ncbi:MULTISPECIES: hypothetical protein [unclassified Streptomyces]|uniref:hypothetical protein n=1 Tax=unclassified Streptomyces TaxID=2593676 RepID=UPI00081EFD5A|nr:MULTISPECIES: hypothetical protein [unclassified Streptomyces]MYZ38429.1 hypothetical protein [Streptomyces sp. SID4917]SCF98429.1 hypothetical protein GA0115259_106341 [Streptomyces sp. MnatMP-M17]